jgi:hypothetical protein
VSRAKEKKINLFSKLYAHLTGTSHLPARGQVCQRCHQKGHLTCWEVSGPDIEHIAMELEDIERRAA